MSGGFYLTDDPRDRLEVTTACFRAVALLMIPGAEIQDQGRTDINTLLGVLTELQSGALQQMHGCA